MRGMRTPRLCLALLLTAVTATAKDRIPTLQEKINASDLVVEVKVDSMEKVRDEGHYIVQLAHCTVSQVLNGGHIGKTLTVQLKTANPSAPMKPSPQVVTPGKTHILFLKRDGDHYVTISPFHGMVVQRRICSEYDEGKADDPEAVRAATAFQGRVPRVAYKYAELIDRILELTGGASQTVAPPPRRPAR